MDRLQRARSDEARSRRRLAQTGLKAVGVLDAVVIPRTIARSHRRPSGRAVRAMRLLLVEEDPKIRALIRHHVSCQWPEAQIRAHPPAVRGPCRPSSSRRATMLCCSRAARGAGAVWLHELVSRPGFAPVIFLADSEAQASAVHATKPAPAASSVSDRIDHAQLHRAAAAGAREHRRALADWRVSARGAGVAPLRRCAHPGLPARAAACARLDLAAVRGREREGRVAGGPEGHSLAARRERRRSGARALPPGVRDRPARAPRQHRAPLRARRRGRSCLSGDGILSQGDLRRRMRAGALAFRGVAALPRRSPGRSARCTRRASCIATSSPATSCCASTSRSR